MAASAFTRTKPPPGVSGEALAAFRVAIPSPKSIAGFDDYLIPVTKACLRQIAAIDLASLGSEIPYIEEWIRLVDPDEPRESPGVRPGKIATRARKHSDKYPIFAMLAVCPDVEPFSGKVNELKGHVLLACLALNARERSIDKNYKNAIQRACDAVRSLSRKEIDSLWFKELRTAGDPEDFLGELEILEEDLAAQCESDNTLEICSVLRNIVTPLRIAIDFFVRERGGGHRRRRKKPETSPFLPVVGIELIVLTPPDIPFGISVVQVQHLGNEGEVTDPSGPRQEDPPPARILDPLDRDNPPSLENPRTLIEQLIALRARYQHAERNAQILPFRMNLLSPNQQKELIRASLTWVDGSHASPDAVLCWVCLWSGRSADEIALTIACQRELREPTCDRPSYRVGSGRISVAVPKNKRAQSTDEKDEPADRPDLTIYEDKKTVIALRMPEIVSDALEALSRKVADGERIFSDDVVGRLRDRLKSIRSAEGNISLTQIESHLWQLLMAMCGDSALATMITGRIEANADVLLFYTLAQEARLNHLHEHAVMMSLNACANNGGAKLDFSVPVQRVEKPSWIGDVDVPCREPLVDVVTKIAGRLESMQCANLDISSALEFHNLYALYFLIGFLLGSGARAVDGLLYEIDGLDSVASAMSLSDKESIDLDKGRMQSLPQELVEMAYAFAEHRRALGDLVLARAPEIAGALYRGEPPFVSFIDPNDRVLKPLTIADVKARLQEWTAIDVDSLRHYFRTRVAAGTDGSSPGIGDPLRGEIVNFGMGHWVDGAAPYGRYSTMFPATVADRLRRRAHLMLEDLGYRAVQSRLVKQCRNRRRA